MGCHGVYWKTVAIMGGGLLKDKTGGRGEEGEEEEEEEENGNRFNGEASEGEGGTEEGRLRRRPSFACQGEPPWI